MPENSSGPDSTGVSSILSLVATEITEFDILLGRGKASYNHDGNRRFRKFIAMHASTYINFDDCFDKSMVIYAVYQSITCARGRFLQYKKSLNGWCEVEPKVARSKIGHAIRDAITLRRDHPGYHDDNVPNNIAVCFRQVSPTDVEDLILNWAERTQPSSVVKLGPQRPPTNHAENSTDVEEASDHGTAVALPADYTAVLTPMMPTALNYSKVYAEHLVAPTKFQEDKTLLLDTVEVEDFDVDYFKEEDSDHVLSVLLQDMLDPCHSVNKEIDSDFSVNVPSSWLKYFIVDDNDDNIFLREIDECLDSNSSEDFKAFIRWHAICGGGTSY
jgi:hypothetical protein